jgi:outer membrane protein OmpA-like peptidoglycan-associated protein
MKPWLVVVGALPLVVLQAAHDSGVVQSQLSELSPIPAAKYITDAFDRYPLVAFSEPRHGASGTKEFLASLIRQPGFAEKVNDIVVEFGNSRYQDVVDRYIAGEPVAHDQLKQAWENTTVATGVWLAPMYEDVLTEVRAVNRSLPPSRRIRVLLGDPPIDWSVVRGPADEDMNDWRDAHFAWVVEERVMKSGRKALIWIGGAHVSRGVMFPDSLIHLLDRRFPNKTLVVVAIDPREVEPHVSARLRTWPSMSAAPVRDTWLGRLNARAIGFRLATGSVEQNIDAALFWESVPDRSDEAPRLDTASTIGVELQRRRQLSESTLPFRGGKIRFEAGTASLSSESEAPLRTVLAELRQDPGLILLVKAFTDAREENGAQLSLERAKLVVGWLTARGIAPERLVAKGCASSRALWFGHTEEERAANRRAELVRKSKWDTCEPPSSFDFR